MFPIIMSILAVTSIYAGILMFNQDSIAGVSGVLLGIILITNPALLVLRRFRTVGDGFHAAKPGDPQKKSPKKNHLRLVKSDQDEERPTIH
jgi:hypothetical protein